MGYVIVLVGLFAVMWLLLIRPQRKRSVAQLTMQDRLRAGDEIITAGGLHGIVREIGEETLQIEIAPGVVGTLDRRAVAAVAREVEVEVDPEDAAEPPPVPG